MLGYTYQLNGSTFQVGTINPDGSGNDLRPEGRSRPLFSPDGNRELVWHFNGTGASLLYVRDVDGANEVPLVPTHAGLIFYASWSPDGSKIGYMLSSSGNLADAEVWTMNANGTGQTQISTGGGGPIDWAMTPSGSKIAYIGGRPLDPSDPCYGWQLWIMNPDGSSPSCVPSVAAFGQDLAYGTFDIKWSPDGTKIAMAASYPSADCGAASCERVGNVWIAPTGAGAATNLTPSSADGQLHAYGIAWSPDGAKLAIAGDTPMPNSITGGVLNAGMGVYITPATAFTPKLVTPALPASSLVNIDHVDWQACIPGVTKTCTSSAPTGGNGSTGTTTTGAAGSSGGTSTGSQATSSTKVVAAKVTATYSAGRLTIHLTLTGKATVQLALVRNHKTVFHSEAFKLKNGKNVFTILHHFPKGRNAGTLLIRSAGGQTTKPIIFEAR